MVTEQIHNLTKDQRLLVSLLGHRVFGAPPETARPEQWDQLLREAEEQSVLPLVYQAAAASFPDVETAARKLNFLRHISHNLNVVHAHHEAHELLSGAGISYTVIKGCASSFYYPEPELRTMGDVDLYVRRADMDRVMELFRAAGYQASGLDHPHHWSFSRDGVENEVHWVPSGIPAADDGSILSLFDDLLERSRPVTWDGQTMVLPDPFHHALIMLLHTANHMTAGGVGLRHLLDWLVFVNSMPEEKFRALLEPTLRRIGLWQFACVLSAVGTQLFGCAPRSFCETVSPELALGLLRDIFDGGNFGVKNTDRLNQSKLLRDNESRQIDGKSGLSHAFRFLNQRARTRFPASARCPLLLPVGWASVLLNRSRAIRAGKQSRLRWQDTLRGARTREQLYGQLHLFEK